MLNVGIYMVSKSFLGVPCGRAVMGFALLGAALLSALANATLHIPNALRHSKNTHPIISHLIPTPQKPLTINN